MSPFMAYPARAMQFTLKKVENKLLTCLRHYGKTCTWLNESAPARDGITQQKEGKKVMKATLSTMQAADMLRRDENANWSNRGARALVEYLEQIEEDTGTDMEMDIVAIRCDYSEYASLVDWAVEYFGTKEDAAFEILGRNSADIEDDEDAIRDYINNRGALIEFPGGIIVSSF
jgi:hypothetical protein